MASHMLRVNVKGMGNNLDTRQPGGRAKDRWNGDVATPID